MIETDQKPLSLYISKTYILARTVFGQCFAFICFSELFSDASSCVFHLFFFWYFSPFNWINGFHTSDGLDNSRTKSIEKFKENCLVFASPWEPQLPWMHMNWAKCQQQITLWHAHTFWLTNWFWKFTEIENNLLRSDSNFFFFFIISNFYFVFYLSL